MTWEEIATQMRQERLEMPKCTSKQAYAQTESLMKTTGIIPTEKKPSSTVGQHIKG